MHTFLTTQGQGVPPRKRDQLNSGATSETTRTRKTIHIIHSPIHSYNMKRWIWKDDYDGQMIFWDLVGLTLPKETSPRKLAPTGYRTRDHCVTGVHATASSTAVDNFNINCQSFMILMVCILHFKNKEHSKCRSNWYISFRDINFNMKISKCSKSVSFEVQHKK